MFTIIGGALIAIPVLWGALFVVNRKAATSLFRWGRAVAGESTRAITDTQLVAQLNEAVTRATDKIAKSKLGIARLGAMKRSLEDQLKSDQAEEQRIINKIKIAKANGDPNNTLVGYAEQLDMRRKSIASNQSQLQVVQQQYDDFAMDVQESNQMIQSAQQKATLLHANLEMSEARREAAEFASAFKPGVATGELAEIMKKVETQTNMNFAMADAQAIGDEQRRGERRDRDLERQANAAAILAEFDPPRPQISHDAGTVPLQIEQRERDEVRR